MTRAAWRCFILLAWACGGTSDPDPAPTDDPMEDPVEEPAFDVELRGIVQKGPFVLGSTVLVSNLDADLEQAGALFTTTTRSDLGEFELEFDAADVISLTGIGSYY